MQASPSDDPAAAGSSHVSATSDSRVGLAYSPYFLEHDTGSRHPESVERLRAIRGALESNGLVDRLVQWEPEPLDEASIALVHPPRYQQVLRVASEQGGARLDPDTIASAGSWAAATRASGAVVEAVRRVASGQLSQAVCLVRPPGHHALPARAMGFCLLNNVAVATAVALHEGLAERIAILDIDVHHGNGTQDVFYQDGRVLYFSTHQYPFYPGTGALHEMGEGAGSGLTINLPLPAGAGDRTYRRSDEEVMRPAVRRFGPSLILVSLGFDAHWRDPLAEIQLSLAGYAGLFGSALALARELCNGKIVFTLEGGYDYEVLGSGISTLCRLLLDGEGGPDPIGPSPLVNEPEGAEAIVNAAMRSHGLT